MDRADLAARDIALATEARALFGKLLTAEDRKKVAAMTAPDELIAYLRRCPGWSRAAGALPLENVKDSLFALEMERQVYRDFEKMYRFAQTTAQEFLILIALRVKCRAILAALRRLSNPGSQTRSDPLPAFFHELPGYDIDRLARVADYPALIAVAGTGVYGDTLRSLPTDKATGLPRYAEAADLLEDAYYVAVRDFLADRYRGAGGEALREVVSFRADMLNISYLLRLRRFGTPPEKARELLIPLSGALSRETEDAILAAPTDEEAIALIMRTRLGKPFKDMDCVEPDRFVRCAERKFFRGVVRGEPNITVPYAYMVLKEAECKMLERVFVALTYGADPEQYM